MSFWYFHDGPLKHDWIKTKICACNAMCNVALQWRPIPVAFKHTLSIITLPPRQYLKQWEVTVIISDDRIDVFVALPLCCRARLLRIQLTRWNDLALLAEKSRSNSKNLYQYRLQRQRLLLSQKVIWVVGTSRIEWLIKVILLIKSCPLSRKTTLPLDCWTNYPNKSPSHPQHQQQHRMIIHWKHWYYMEFLLLRSRLPFWLQPSLSTRSLLCYRQWLYYCLGSGWHEPLSFPRKR